MDDVTSNPKSLIISDLQGNPFRWVRGSYTVKYALPSHIGRRFLVPQKNIEIYEPDFSSAIEDLLNMPLENEKEFIKSLRRFYKKHGPLGAYLFEMEKSIQEFLYQAAGKREPLDKTIATKQWLSFAGVSQIYQSIDDFEWWYSYRESISYACLLIRQFRGTVQELVVNRSIEKVEYRFVFAGKEHEVVVNNSSHSTLLKTTIQFINGQLVCPVQSLLGGIYAYLILQWHEGKELKACRGVQHPELRCTSCPYGKLYFWNIDIRQEWGDKECIKYAKVRVAISRQRKKAIELFKQGNSIDEVFEILNKGKYKVSREEIENWHKKLAKNKTTRKPKQAKASK